MSAINKLKSNSKNIYLFDPVPHLCTEELCSTHTEGNLLLFKDDDHLSDNALKNIIGPTFRDFVTKNKLNGSYLFE